MSTAVSGITSLSHGLVELVEKSLAGVVAVKAAPYRVTSGVALSHDLVAVTSHTLRRETPIPIQTAGGSQCEGTILGRDPSVDLAFIRVEGLTLQPISKCDPNTVKAGILTTVIGLTIDAGPSVSLGVMGAVGGERKMWRGGGGGSLDHFFRLDVNLYPSQSGAVVVDPEGALIGMATPALLRHSALAVPVSTMNRIADEISKEGRIRRGYLGVGLQPVVIPKTLVEKIGAFETGLIVLSVESGSPAENAGWQLGDILVSLDSAPISDVEELQTVLRGERVGRPSIAVLIRGGQKVESEVTIAERRERGK